MLNTLEFAAVLAALCVLAALPLLLDYANRHGRRTRRQSSNRAYSLADRLER